MSCMVSWIDVSESDATSDPWDQPAYQATAARVFGLLGDGVEDLEQDVVGIDALGLRLEVQAGRDGGGWGDRRGGGLRSSR